MDYKKLITKGESKTLELKEIIPSHDKIAKTVCAFANTSGGKLIIGVKDNLEIIGIDDANIFEIKDSLISVIYDKISPLIMIDIFTVAIENKLILVIDVSKGPQSPYHIKKAGNKEEVYIRLGATNRKADNETINDLHRQSRNTSFDEEIDYNLDFEDLDLSPLSTRFKKLGIDLDESSFLNLGLAKKEINKLYPTKGLLILLGLYEHSCIKCAKFKGDNMVEFIDKKEYTGNIFSQLENAESFCYNHINVGAKIKGLQREDIPEVPLEAIREALLNAIVHRDYTNSGRDIKVNIFDSYISINSPGSLPPKITYEDIFNGRSEIRNKVLARVMNKLNFIEKWGTGINRILISCENRGLKKPEIIEKNDFFEVKLFRPEAESSVNNNQTIEYPRSITVDYDRLRSITVDYGRLEIEKQDILLYLLDNKTITRKQVIDVFDFKTTKATNLLAEMTEEKLLVRKGSGRSTYYMLKKD